MTKWEIGDVVRLKSGGPVMTVIETDILDEEGVHVDGVVACGWFHPDGEGHRADYRTEEFHAASLVEARPPRYGEDAFRE